MRRRWEPQVAEALRRRNQRCFLFPAKQWKLHIHIRIAYPVDSRGNFIIYCFTLFVFFFFLHITTCIYFMLIKLSKFCSFFNLLYFEFEWTGKGLLWREAGTSIVSAPDLYILTCVYILLDMGEDISLYNVCLCVSSSTCRHRRFFLSFFFFLCKCEGHHRSSKRTADIVLLDAALFNRIAHSVFFSCHNLSNYLFLNVSYTGSGI